MKKYLLLISLAIGLVSNTYANDWFLQAGLHAGGDELAGVTFVSGSTSTIEAGGLVSVAGGINLDLTSTSQLRLTLGYKIDDITASNGSITFDRTTVEAAWFYALDDKWNIGAGVTQHIDPLLEGTGVVSGRVAFQDATGVTFQVDYRFSSGMYIGGNFTSIDYETVSGAATVSGDSLGILFGWRF